MTALLLPPVPSSAEGPVRNADGTVVAFLSQRSRYGPFRIADPYGNTLLEGRKRSSFMYARGWDATDPQGVRRISMTVGQFRTKTAEIVLAGGASLTVEATGKPLTGLVRAADGVAIAEFGTAPDGDFRVSQIRPDLDLVEILGVLSLRRLAFTYGEASSNAGVANLGLQG